MVGTGSADLGGHVDTASRPIDFFSYSPADERWATWIAWELETAGYTIMLQAWDFVPGTNFIEFMDRGSARPPSSSPCCPAAT
ncbi:MAG TPA: toll/interleukin-1 receptor domain-containing protein [Mycobacteriales bacterium]|nr:toll/interleukin-1 receptor domain-containing protein [Mycobacteriales bacterium]